MMNKWRLISITLTALLLFAACGNTEYEVEEDIIEIIEEIEEQIEEIIEKPRAEIIPLDLQYAMDIARIRREAIEKPDYTALLPLTEGREPSSGLLRELWGMQGGQLAGRIHTDDAIEDARLLFQLLHETYGGYVYFGGDDVFLPMLEAIEADLFAMNTDYLLLIRFLDILHEHLSSVIADNHFSLGHRRMGPNVSYFFSATLRYDRSENGFRNSETDLYLLKIDGHHDIYDVMKLHADTDGRLFYRPVLLAKGSTPYYVTYFVYENDGLERRSFAREPNRSWPQIELPSLRWIDGVPVVQLMMMGNDIVPGAWGYEHVAPFLATAEYVRDEPVVIVDLRGNGGGGTMIATRWLYAITGELVSNNYMGVGPVLDFGPLSDAMEDGTISQETLDRIEYYSSHIESMVFDNDHWATHIEPRRIISREQMMIFLTDRNIASAAEGFIDISFNLENTLVIGQATSGTMMADGGLRTVLPNSGLGVVFGGGLTPWPEGLFAEGAGILPDIWVSGDALDIALALLDL